MKPRIQPYRDILWCLDYIKWRLVGGGRAGFGGSPKDAYWDWKARVSEGVKFKAQEGEE